ncbi:hypothetical protein LTR41_011504 [Exophiala xenobiotica]|nr:hypothetical protein LTR41_011504 [Exophiala xenobiotica]KAK5550707.1 hypothetical protein LTR46_011284 [Exophiala xenobiotica]
MADLGQQPNPDRIHQSFRTLTEEFEKLPNLPAFDTGNAILHALEQLTIKLDTFVQHTNQRFDRIENKIDDVQYRLAANDHNSAARVQNAHLTRASDSLYPLVKPSTNTVIEGFPIVPRDISTMQPATLHSVLRDLGLTTDGRRADKEKRLRQHIGLQPSPDVA